MARFTAPATAPSLSEALRQLEAGLDYRLILVLVDEGGRGRLPVLQDAGSTDVIGLLERWVQVAGMPVQVLPLGREDGSVPVFLDHLEAALDGWVDRVHETDRTPDQRLVDLANGAMAVSEEMALVLVGFDVLASSAAVQRVVETLADYLPPHMHLYLVTRTPPAFSNLARLRVRRQLLVIDWTPTRSAGNQGRGCGP